jgi:hypothetical protein
MIYLNAGILVDSNYKKAQKAQLSPRKFSFCYHVGEKTNGTMSLSFK